MNDDDVTQWVGGMAQGDEQAAQRIWERYYAQLLPMARRKLGGRRRIVDEEDAVLSAFHSFCRGLDAGRFPRLNDRHDLWKVLLSLTARKAALYNRRENAEKRGGGKVRGASVFSANGSAEHLGEIGAVLGTEPTPEFAALVSDECGQLLDELDDESQRQIAILKLEGYTNQEISERLDMGLRTVERKLTLIRGKWAKQADL